MSISWKSIKTFEDIKLERGENSAEGILKITINRPEVRNAFRPQTVFELKEAFNFAREDDKSGVVFNNTSKDLAKAINIVLNKKNNYDYSRNIKKNKKKYSWDRFADELIKFTFNI